jgi:hypothetical protein
MRMNVALRVPSTLRALPFLVAETAVAVIGKSDRLMKRERIVAALNSDGITILVKDPVAYVGDATLAMCERSCSICR